MAASVNVGEIMGSIGQFIIVGTRMCHAATFTADGLHGRIIPMPLMDLDRAKSHKLSDSPTCIGRLYESLSAITGRKEGAVEFYYPIQARIQDSEGGGGSYIQKGGGGFVQEFQERIQIVAGSWANQQAKKNCRQP